MSLAWNKSTDNSTNFWYCVQLSGSGCFRVNPPQTTWTHPLQMPNRTYSFSVKAVDRAGNHSASSNTVTVTTPPDTTPPSPTPVLSLTYLKPTRIGVSWTAATDDFSQVFYTFLVDGAMHVGSAIGLRSYTVLELAPESTHTFQVSARDASGNSVQSNVLTVTTPPKADDNPPTVPTNFRLSSEASPPEIWLDWDQSTGRHRPAVGDPLRGLPERRGGRRAGRARDRGRAGLLRRRGSGEHARDPRHRLVRKRIGGEQPDQLRLLVAQPASRSPPPPGGGRGASRRLESSLAS